MYMIEITLIATIDDGFQSSRRRRRRDEGMGGRRSPNRGNQCVLVVLAVEQPNMSEITYVALVPKDSSAKLRDVLMEEDTGPLIWREERSRRGSEFYFTGPSELARQTHEFVTLWVANQRIGKLVGRTAAPPSHRPWRSAIGRAAYPVTGLAVFALIAFSGNGAFG